MKAAAVVADILKREGVEFLIGYPVNQIIEAAAEADIRTIIVRQERVGLHMADAVSRVSSGDRIGVFAMQHGPGSENSFGGVAQAFGDSVPIVVLPGGYPRRLLNITPNFSSFLNYQHVVKWAEQVVLPDAVPDAMRRAFTQVKNGRPRPVLVEIPVDVMREEVADGWTYTPAPRLRVAPDPRAVTEVAAALVAAERPVIYAGQGVHYAKARGAARSTGHDEPAGQERVSRDASALARLRRTLDQQAPAPLPHARRPHLRHRLFVRDDELRRADAQGQEDRARHARSARHQQGRPRRDGAGRRRGAHARRAARRDTRPAQGQAARPDDRRQCRDQPPQDRMAGAVDAAPHGEEHAPVALPRDL